MSEHAPRRGARIWPWLAGAGGLAVLWLVTFHATGLLWWNAPDDYGARTARYEPLVLGVPGESAESSESAGR